LYYHQHPHGNQHSRVLFYSAGHRPKKDNRQKAQKAMTGDKFPGK
jgi:hypothetical protein